MAMAIDTSYLTTQVTSIVGQLHGLFDEIGVPSHDRESREQEVSDIFRAVAEELMLIYTCIAFRVPIRHPPEPPAARYLVRDHGKIYALCTPTNYC